MVAKGEGGGGGMEWEFRISRRKLVCVGWINNKVLLYRELRSISYDKLYGKEDEKERMYV